MHPAQLTAIGFALLGCVAALAAEPAATHTLAPVPPTGIETCLALDQKQRDWPTPQACAAAGPYGLMPKQDGMPSTRPLAYETVGDHPLTSCVRDRVSGLVWEGKTDSGTLEALFQTPNPKAPGTLIETFGTHNEPAPGSRANTDAYSYWGDARPGEAMAYVAQVNAMRLCGFGDWRLPTVAELQGLVDLGRAAQMLFGRRTIQPAVDTRWLPNTVQGNYLSVEPLDDRRMWCVNFGTGAVIGCQRIMGPKTAPIFVRLVRGAEAPDTGRWQAATDERGKAGGVVEDRLTGLVWRRCEEPQVWNGEQCRGTAQSYDYVQALQRAGQQKGWRLPTIKEVNTLTERWYKKLELPASGFLPPGTGGPWLRAGYWSASVCASKPKTDTAYAFIRGWALGDNGNVFCETRTELHGVRLVRE